ncbi:MAG TPA: hypothetical protein VMU17_07485 [Elusimicrobiota bacterium]|nr:hypothetical protein [Elusimicrobiota bacterium]
MAATPSRVQPILPTRPVRVLVIADTVPGLSALSALVTTWGFQALPTTKIREAIHYMHERPVDLLILQGAMSAVVYGPVLERLAQEAVARVIPILFSNAFRDSSAEAAAVKSRIAGKLSMHYVPYPFTPSALKAEIERIVADKNRQTITPQIVALESSYSEDSAVAKQTRRFWHKTRMLMLGALIILGGAYYALTQRLFRASVESRQQQAAANDASMKQLLDFSGMPGR